MVTWMDKEPITTQIIQSILDNGKIVNIMDLELNINMEQDRFQATGSMVDM